VDQTSLARHWFLKTALDYLGTPYVWGGDDPSGFDCSGFVVECLKSAGLIAEHEDFTAESLRRKFAACRIDKPRAGALLFSLSRRGHIASHVVICLDEFFQIGASGGSRVTVDKPSAWKDNAYVRIRPICLVASRYEICDPFTLSEG